MSISPQSLARTRDKRSLKVPARFDDFTSVIPPEVTYKNVAQALKLKGKCSNDENVIKKSSLQPANGVINSLKAPVSSIVDEPQADKKKVSHSGQAKNSNSSNVSVTRSTPQNTGRQVDNSNKKQKIAHVSPKTASQANVCNPVETSTEKIPHKQCSDGSTSSNGPSLLRANPISNAITKSKKSSRGYSLIKPINQSNQDVTNDSVGGPSPNRNWKYLTAPISQQSQQYMPSRLLYNQPLTLPRSVGTIAPITTNLQQISARARKPPFASKKAEAYITYQEDRRVEYMLSNYYSLVRLTQLLDFRDLISLRSTNRSWQSMVDSEAVWKKVTFTARCKTKDWMTFSNKILQKYQTNKLVFDEKVPDISFIQAITLPGVALKHLDIKTRSDHDNKLAMELLCMLNSQAADLNQKLTITWSVQVHVNDQGYGLVPIETSIRYPEEDKIVTPYCYDVCAELHSPENTRVMVEFSDLQYLFNGRRFDHSEASLDLRPVVELVAI